MVKNNKHKDGGNSRRFSPYRRPGRNLPVRQQLQRSQAAEQQQAAQTAQVEPQESTSTVPAQQTRTPEPRDGSQSQSGGFNQRGGFGQSGGFNNREGSQSQRGGSSQRKGSQSRRGGHHGFSTRGVPMNSLERVPEAKLVEISDHQGLRRWKLVNTSIPGGNSNHWVTPSLEGGVWGASKDSDSIKFWADSVMEDNDCNVARDEFQRRTTHNYGRGRDGEPEYLPPVVQSGRN